MRIANQVKPSAMTSVRLWAASVRRAKLLANIPAPASMITKASVRKSDRERRTVVFCDTSRKCVCEDLLSIFSLTNLPIRVLRAQVPNDKVLQHDHHPGHKKPVAHFCDCVPAAIVVIHAIDVTRQTQ